MNARTRKAVKHKIGEPVKTMNALAQSMARGEHLHLKFEAIGKGKVYASGWWQNLQFRIMGKLLRDGRIRRVEKAKGSGK